MPCDSISVSSVKFSESTNTDLLAKAMVALGFKLSVNNEQTMQFEKGGYNESVTYYKQTHKMEIRQTRYVAQLTEAQIKQQYGVQTVEYAAKKFGWLLQPDKNNPMKFQAIKRF